MGEMRWLSQEGDERLEWDPADKASVKAAKEQFTKLQGEGYLFYEVTEARGKPVEKFNPKAGKMLAAPGARSAADKEQGTRTRAMAGGPNEARSFGFGGSRFGKTLELERLAGRSR